MPAVVLSLVTVMLATPLLSVTAEYTFVPLVLLSIVPVPVRPGVFVPGVSVKYTTLPDLSVSVSVTLTL